MTVSPGDTVVNLPKRGGGTVAVRASSAISPGDTAISAPGSGGIMIKPATIAPGDPVIKLPTLTGGPIIFGVVVPSPPVITGSLLIGQRGSSLMTTYTSTDGGATWTVTNPTATLPGDVPAYCYVGAGVGYALLQDHIYKTTDYGVTWEIWIPSFICAEDGYTYKAPSFCTRMYYDSSTDELMVYLWRYPYRYYRFFKINVITKTLRSTQIIYSYLGGVVGGYCPSMVRSDDGTLVTCYDRSESPCGVKIYRSIDNGETWTTAADFPGLGQCGGFINRVGVNRLLFHPYEDTCLVMYSSLDAGLTWSPTANAPYRLPGDTECFFSLGGGIVILTAFSTSYNLCNIYRSTNYGLTWTLVASPEAPHSSAMASWSSGTGVVFIALSGTYGTGSAGLISMDYGQTWTQLSTTAMPPAGAWALMYMPDAAP